jgi:predicted RNA-binding Zn-ribbon protein involved in translation (DUF1610 family)
MGALAKMEYRIFPRCPTCMDESFAPYFCNQCGEFTAMTSQQSTDPDKPICGHCDSTDVEHVTRCLSCRHIVKTYTTHKVLNAGRICNANADGLHVY